MDDDNKPESYKRRKKPTQNRGKSTVEFIIEGARRIIISDGYEAATTNHIAEVAGVSVGSLYQYFPNREAIVLALVEETVSVAATKVRKQLHGLMGDPLEESMVNLIRMLVATYQENEFILLRIFNKIPDLREHASQLAVQKFTRSTNLAFLQQHEHEITRKDLPTALLFVENAVISNIDVYIETNPLEMSEDEFVSEMVSLVVNYLTK